jgi:hypothetical protein
LKKTNDVRVSINHRFFQDFQPIPFEDMKSGPLLKTVLEAPGLGLSKAAKEADISTVSLMNQHCHCH